MRSRSASTRFLPRTTIGVDRTRSARPRRLGRPPAAENHLFSGIEIAITPRPVHELDCNAIARTTRIRRQANRRIPSTQPHQSFDRTH